MIKVQVRTERRRQGLETWRVVRVYFLILRVYIHETLITSNCVT